MVWSAPMTAVAGSVFTAAQYNTYVRDNLLQTAPALATAAGQYFAASGANGIAARTLGTATVSALESTSSTSYGDLTTVGPAVTATTGTSAVVGLYCAALTSGAATATFMSWDVGGDSSVSAADNTALSTRDTSGVRIGGWFLQTGLTAGSNVFTARYRSGAANSTSYSDRRIIVMPL